MSDRTCCYALFSFCNPNGANPFCYCCCPPRRRKSNFDDDEVVRENQPPPSAKQNPTSDPETGYHVNQPEPVAQMSTYPPPAQPSSQHQQQPVHQSQPVHQPQPMHQSQPVHQPQRSSENHGSQYARGNSSGQFENDQGAWL
ncbi:hypothetical protein D9756_005622 [Leucocoprinus leucothites]|uniref:Uncharacterized protein n=1 Tax=Leucocoprinus leucothites TaxID=201217 RepID=A0A8H5FZX1_9AGAR|nr:hypothetical protein D9756_005622 [Leucoagaricus leucothites]